ncbi:type II secretion system F family protein [Criibacterium bergeronii]|uniref:Type II secretion system F family protein n=1 Tax=Criibacterium bergeronii TaxID=1871336 RepID=A0A371IJ67_9FIRM|nr:type II secretion system F family protein [Criibacterium bergeronii]MBS6064063.1 type II secretion system F family protein [Peptostreptococcaceae bacterium]RDY20514.1 type II secretion system F family protein [Criibacterium bergeronii]
MNSKLTNSELSLFCYQLSLIFKSGIPLMEAMDLFTEEMTTPVLKDISVQMDKDIKDGKSLYDALKDHKEFPLYMLGMVEIAQNTGNLEEELSRLSDYYQEQEELNQKISNAVTYPIVLVILMTLVILYLIIQVVPMFHNILTSIGTDIPAGTQALLNFGLFLRNNGLVIIGLIALIIAGTFWYKSTKNGSLAFDKMKYTMPVIGEMNQKILAEKFSLGMSMLMSGGYSFDDALNMYINCVDSPFVKDRLSIARTAITNGSNVSEEIANLNIFPKLFSKMLSIGYKTGELESSFKKISQVYKTQVEKVMNKVTSSIEPALVIALSIIIGVILISVMSPLITIISTI